MRSGALLSHRSMEEIVHIDDLMTREQADDDRAGRPGGKGSHEEWELPTMSARKRNRGTLRSSLETMQEGG